MRRLFSIIFISLFLVGMFVQEPPVDEFAYAKSSQKKYTVEKNIGSKGLVLNPEKGEAKCGPINVVESFDELDEEATGYNFNDILSSLLINFGAGTINFLAKQVESIDSCGKGKDVKFDGVEEEGDEDEDEGGFKFGLMNQLNVFPVLVNITDVELLMFLTNIIQSMAMILIVFFLLYQIINILRGKRYINEDAAVGIVLRFGIVMGLVYYAPAILQDILSINNMLVHTLGEQTIPIEVGGGDAEVPIKFAPVTSLGLFLSLLIKALGFVAVGGSFLVFIGAAAVMTIILIALSMIVLVLIPFIKIIIWWYTRLFKIFVFTIMSPLFLMTFTSQETSKYGSGFVVNYIKTVFEQFFVMLGFAVLLVFFVELPNIAEELSIGFVGVGIGLYAGFTFVTQIPEVVGMMIDGAVGFNSRGMQRGVNKTFGRAKGKAKRFTKRSVKRIRGR